MLTVARKVLALLERGERWRLMWLLALTVVMALIQMVGVASIMPFMSVVANPGLIQENRWMSQVYNALPFGSPRDFLLFSGIVVLGVIALGNAVSAFTTWSLLRFAWGVQHSLAVRLLKQYLDEPYSFYLNRNTAALSKNILAEVKEVIGGIIVPGLKMLAQVVVALAILGLLVFADPRVATTAALLLGGSFGAIYVAVRRQQVRLGRVRNRMNAERFKVSTEALAGIKETKVLGREQEFLARFATPNRRYSRANASNAVISELPKYALETLTFGGVVLLVLYQISIRDDFGQAIAVISLYALAGYRLMPSLQAIFNGVAKIRFFRPALDNLHSDLIGRPQSDSWYGEPGKPTRGPLAFEHAIEVDGVSFRYPGREEYVARGLHLTIPKNSTVGFVGGTGSGKSTLVDIILGLLEPEEGSIRIDGVALGPENMARWRKKLGYVPQHIFLCDDTITQNIAFGIPAESIDHAAVERAARVANLHAFVTELPDGYATVVGDRGVRLSGGQRQRIGIARALYHDPDVLVMDEATSALDGITEDAVMEAIGSISGQKTIILVAHRLSTIQDCDAIYLFERGKIVVSGTYDELISTSKQFRAMAKVGPGEGAIA
jgi:ATP-binding cassette, subfamily B, bacterial PglK